MDTFFGMGVGSLIWLAFVFNLFGFLARDELFLRLFMLVGSVLSIGYYSLIVSDQPLWDAILTRGTLMIANFVMIIIVITERTTLFMSQDALELYRSFNMLTPGQFRKLMRVTQTGVAGSSEVVLEEGRVADRLYFITKGNARVEKAGIYADIGERVFLGEIAYLRGGAATATVTLNEGTEYLSWDHASLQKMNRRNRELSVAMVAQFNEDLLNKVAGSPPADMHLSQAASRTV